MPTDTLRTVTYPGRKWRRHKAIKSARKRGEHEFAELLERLGRIGLWGFDFKSNEASIAKFGRLAQQLMTHGIPEDRYLELVIALDRATHLYAKGDSERSRIERVRAHGTNKELDQVAKALDDARRLCGALDWQAREFMEPTYPGVRLDDVLRQASCQAKEYKSPRGEVGDRGLHAFVKALLEFWNNHIEATACDAFDQRYAGPDDQKMSFVPRNNVSRFMLEAARALIDPHLRGVTVRSMMRSVTSKPRRKLIS